MGRKVNQKWQKNKKVDLGMQSVKYGLDNNPAITAADPKAKFIAPIKKQVVECQRCQNTEMVEFLEVVVLKSKVKNLKAYFSGS